MKQQEIVFSGFGGQGVMFIGQLLAYAAMDSGYEVTWIPSYGPEMRGGTAHCIVVVSEKPIGSPVVRHPQIAVVFNNPSFDKYENQIAEGGLLIVNSSLVKREVTRENIEVLDVPATEIAEEIGSRNLSNVVLLSALLARRPILTHEQLHEALDAHIPKHRREWLPDNYNALERGLQYVKAEFVP
jgi:2-oxoglutarate ferredoxin oxidoreductase subunit gamma